MHREKPHKLLQVGVIPTPATTACAGPPWEMIQLADCKSAVIKHCWKRQLERYQHFPPFRIRSSIRGAARCLREGSLRTATRAQIPSGPPISELTARLIPRVSALRISTPAFFENRSELSARSVVATHSGWDRGWWPCASTRCNSCRADQF